MWSWFFHSKPVNRIPALLWNKSIARVPYAAELERGDQDRLRGLVEWFLQAKTFEGAAGLVVNEQMRIDIALQASLLILNLDRDYYSGWHAVILYPADFIVPKEIMDDDGVVHQWTEEIAGESWEQGPVILSWDAAYKSDPGMNIVIHEFAHKLDMHGGAPNGCPPLPAGLSASDWARDFQNAYDRFCADVDALKPVRIDEYAAESPAEFFAVLSESFFTTPRIVVEDFPPLYRHLKEFYRQDPLLLLASS